MQRKKIAWLPGLLEREKKTKSFVFFDIIFDIYTHADNEKSLGDEFCWKKNMKIS